MAQVGGGAGAWPFGARRSAPVGAAAGRLLAGVARQLEAEQERWFLWLPVLFGGGIALYFALPVEPLILVAPMPAVAALALYLAGPRAGLGGRLGGLVTAALLAVALGVAAAKLRTEAVRAPVFQGQPFQGQPQGRKPDKARPLDVYGQVELVEPRAAGKGQRLTIRVTALEKHEAGAWPLRVRIVTRAETAGLKPGDVVRVKATLNPPPGPTLPGDYDFARAAWFKGLGAVGYAGAAAAIDPHAPAPTLAQRAGAAIARVRQAIGQRILAALPGETGAIANALITGERGGISEETNQAFRNSGLFHILSISGLHMVIMAGAVFLSIRATLAAIPAVALRYPIKKWAATGAMLGAFGYLLISGAEFATVRSYIMISIMFLAVLLDRPAIALRNVALAALAILVLWPESLLDAGFQMSFAAVVALVATYEALRMRAVERDGPARRGWLATGAAFLGGILTTTLIASLAVAPFGIYHFHNTQAFAMLANLLAIPLCNFVVMPAALAVLLAMPFGLEAVPLWVMGLGIDGMVWCAHVVSALPGAVGRVPAIPTSAFALHRGGRPVVRPVEHALAAHGRGAHRAWADAGPDRAEARRPDRPRCQPGGGARRRRPPLGAGGARLQLRAGTLAGARRRRPLPGGGRQGVRLPLRPPGLHRAREGPAPGGRQVGGGFAGRLHPGRDPDRPVPQARRAADRRGPPSTATTWRPAAPTPSRSRTATCVWTRWPRPAGCVHGPCGGPRRGPRGPSKPMHQSCRPTGPTM